ncbi:MAG: TraR/DksA family transcriptional regulator [bacterium]|nr:TraR/DksA family transcriptional regulator [bacterium]MCP4799251.1 TraR/DksA family transcriptional regulator [bacterium]
MRKTELERFRKLLVIEKERVEKSLHKHTQTITHEGEVGGEGAKAHSNHMADQGSDEFQYETNIQISSSEGRYLYQLEQALLRIEDASYGKCDNCAKPIGMPRLKAKLDARLCIDCKEKEERGLI